MEYKPPAFRQPEQYNLPQSIDQVFQNYLQTRQAFNNEARQRATDIGAFGFDPTQVSPADWQRNMTPQQAAPQPDQGQGMYQNPGMPVQPQDPHDQSIQNFLSLRRQQMQLAAQQAQVGLSLEQGKAREQNTRADLIGAPPWSLNAPSPWSPNVAPGGTNVITGTVDQMQAGNLAPNDLMDAAGRDPLIRMAMQNEANKRGIDQVSLQRKVDVLKSGAIEKGNVQQKQGQLVGSLAGTLEDTLNQVEPLIKQLNTSQVSLLNKAWITGLKQVNDPRVKKIITYLNEAKGLYSSVLANGNSPQQADKQQSDETFGVGIDAPGFAALKQAVNFTAQRKVKRIMGEGFNEPPPNPIDTEAAIVTRTLHNGQKVRVRQAADGKYHEVP